MEGTNNNEINKEPNNIDSERVTTDIMKQIINEMVTYPVKLQSGYSLFSKIETCRGFYSSLLTLILCNQCSKSEIKLASSVLLNFLRKNWSDDNFISIEEKMEIFMGLTTNILHSDYYLNNFVAKVLGIISAKEWPNSYEVLIKKIIKSLIESKDPNSTEIYLRIINSILVECDDRIAQMTSELLPVIIDVFKNSNVSIIYIYIYILLKHAFTNRKTKRTGKNA